ncbi:hypothetical protein [Legionella shakespearei]|uniref:Uncharacterized protein n=1 Tax=Legionella shakespearei DSM 23087 TaxID=1122169 RepID=A0A0W0Z7K3_9GAMM|nr:hypothetical protein [Legionella shakespearei]KTD65101.1 hypothetical protein Lsha_0470 [Legionella shakespearei DSM 23087]
MKLFKQKSYNLMNQFTNSTIGELTTSAVAVLTTVNMMMGTLAFTAGSCFIVLSPVAPIGLPPGLFLINAGAIMVTGSNLVILIDEELRKKFDRDYDGRMLFIEFCEETADDLLNLRP